MPVQYRCTELVIAYLEPGEGGGGVVEAGQVALHRLFEGVRQLHGEEVCVEAEQVHGEGVAADRAKHTRLKQDENRGIVRRECVPFSLFTPRDKPLPAEERLPWQEYDPV